MSWTPVQIREVQLRSQRRLEFASLLLTFASRIEVANREPGHRVAVAIVTVGAPGLPQVRAWVVKLHSHTVIDPRAKRAAEIQNAIGRILYREWDPIGVSGLAPEDEYDSYIAPVYRILSGSRSEQELIELLFYIERESIGLSCTSPERLRPVARRLLELDVNL